MYLESECVFFIPSFSFENFILSISYMNCCECLFILYSFTYRIFFLSHFSGLNSINNCLTNGTIMNNNNNSNTANNNNNMSNTSNTIVATNNNNSINNNNNNVLNNNLNGSTETLCTSGGEQPDPDFIKMFVGQVPKSMDEDQLREMFEEFGRVHSINVLRDKVTGVSKGNYTHLFKARLLLRNISLKFFL